MIDDGDIYRARNLPVSTPGPRDTAIGVDESTGALRRFELGAMPLPASAEDRLHVLEISQGDGVPGVATYADIATLFPTPTEGQQVDVLLDAASANLGRWGYIGGAWQKSGDRVTELEGEVAAIEPKVAPLSAKGSETEGLHRFLWEGPDGTRYLLALFRDTDGAFVPTRLVIPAGTEGVADTIPSEVIHGYRWSIDGRMLMTADVAQGFYPRRMLIPADAKLDDNPDSTLAERLDAGGTLPLESIAFWGDSFMTGDHGSGTYPAQVGASLGRTVNNGGIGGQTSTQILARMGAHFARLTVTGNEIPASGGVSVTSISNRLLSTPSTTAATRNITGTLAGIPGTLSCVESASGDGSDAYTFTRTSAGAATFCGPDTPFIPDTQYLGWTTVIGVGRNNVGALDTILDEVAAAVASLSHGHYLVVGVTNGSTEPSGSAGHTNVVVLNQALAERYGDRFVELREYLIHQGLADAGITPTAQDTTDIANDVVPDSLRSDTLHPNDAGNVLIAALVSARITYKGY